METANLGIRIESLTHTQCFISVTVLVGCSVLQCRVLSPLPSQRQGLTDQQRRSRHSRDATSPTHTSTVWCRGVPAGSSLLTAVHQDARLVVAELWPARLATAPIRPSRLRHAPLVPRVHCPTPPLTYPFTDQVGGGPYEAARGGVAWIAPGRQRIVLELTPSRPPPPPQAPTQTAPPPPCVR